MHSKDDCHNVVNGALGVVGTIIGVTLGCLACCYAACAGCGVAYYRGLKEEENTTYVVGGGGVINNNVCFVLFVYSCLYSLRFCSTHRLSLNLNNRMFNRLILLRHRRLTVKRWAAMFLLSTPTSNKMLSDIL
jgi:hypothetical protein